MNRFINVTQSSMPPLDEYIDEIKEMWDTRWLTNMGTKYNKLKEELEDYLEIDNVQILVNGHMALELALQSLTQPGGEVITTPFTFVSTTDAIIRSGLKPVFCDIDDKSYTIDVNKIENLITEKTVAILPVHVYGNICDVKAIEDIAHKYNLKVIYDAAHSFGEKIDGKGVASYGDASCFSFHATKVFHTIEGGAVCSKNPVIIDKIRIMSDFGINKQDEFDCVGTNAKINEFAAAMGICNLRYINENIEKRKIIYHEYIHLLENVEGIQLNYIADNVESNYAYFPIVIDENVAGYSREDLMNELRDKGINTRKYFYPLTCEVVSETIKYTVPIARYVSERVMTLPLYSELDIENVNRICNIIKYFKV